LTDPSPVRPSGGPPADEPEPERDPHAGGDAVADPAERALVVRAARGGLCAACAHARAVVSSRSAAFLRCDAPGLPRYPVVPVIACDGFALRDA
jgi:hypothetical protein